MTFMLCRNRVADYEKWLAIFKAQEVPQEKTGLTLTHMWRSVEDANNVFFMFKVDSIEKAKAFIEDPANAELGEEAGVIDGEYHFIEDAGD